MYSKLRKTAGIAVAAAVVASCLTQGAALSAAETAATPETYDIVALGDSLAAGYEHGFTAESVPYGFVEHVYEQALFQGLRAEYENYGVIGLKSEGLSKWVAAAAAGEASVGKDSIQPGLSDPRADQIFAQTAQLKKDLQEAELVLIAIGGNDFLSLIKNLQNGDSPAAYEDMAPADQQALQTALDSLLSGYEQQLKATIEEVRKLQPNAQIVVANQYLPIPFAKIKGEVMYYIPQSTAEFLVDGQAKLLEILEDVIGEFEAEQVDIKMADAAAAIEKNVLIYTNVGKKGEEQDVHPTRDGYAAMGKAFAEAIFGEFKTVSKKPAGVPISVVVNGKELKTSYTPRVKNGRTFVAIADITDAIGAARTWDAKTNTATIKLKNRTVELTIGAKTIKVDGKTVPLNAEPAYFEQFPGEKKTYVPLAALSEGLGLQVEYREILDTAFINP
ncbi:stalk domain-containing protein [Paenibacillus soyae]|uniref:Stalk domain-containing protein n=1 Tax=Paenibacillus soyae TaxID=2969249 RepID=A0A9X2MUL1_9BACL|nr:stalk domain-containing protein [Paenibacillus soyae]MCR2806131.1 stalk domain-containing protein [Paenibacillus soyae]